jgi:peptidoglycan/LPS O-acetylase OafA/YrhL
VASDQLRHLPYLDGVRAVAILLVFCVHLPFVAGSPVSEAFWTAAQSLRTGYVGVELFFVLSGFLISRILLAERREIGRIAFSAFYINRALRIFPIYYLCVAVYAVVFTSNRDELLSLITYTMNFYRPLHPTQAALEHTWSLSVEEQFYLVWPFVIAAIPLRWGRALTTVIIPLASVLTALAIAISFEGALGADLIYMSVVTRMLSLSLGASLAFEEAEGGAAADGRQAMRVLGIGVIAVVADNIGRKVGVPPAGDYYWCFVLIGYAAFAFGAIAALVHGKNKVVGLLRRFLSLPPLRYLGRISYGLYLYHYPILFLFGLSPYRLEHVGTTFGRAATALVTIFVTAHLSFRYLESPLLRLKRRRPAKLRGDAPAA